MIVKTEIDNAQTDKPVSTRMFAAIRRTTACAAEKMGISFPSEISMKLVSENEIQQLNRDFRNVDSVTDVLSFPSGEYSDGDCPPELRRNQRLFLGDIAICVSVAYKQAAEAKHSPSDEIMLLTAHSFLHLIGFDHATKKQEKEMFALQEEIVRMAKEKAAERKGS